MKNCKLNCNETHLMYNLRYLVSKMYGSQKEFAKALGISEPALTKYLNGSSEPAIHVMMKIKQLHNISIDRLLYQFVDDKDDTITAKEVINADQSFYDKFLGFYHIYYFNTNTNYLHSLSLEKSLKYGLLFLYKTTNDLGLATYHSIAVFGLNRESSVNYAYLKKKDFKEIKDTFYHLAGKSEHVYCYKGVYDVIGSAVYIDLLNSKKEKASLILSNPNSEKDYIGGLGTIASLSRGGEHNACVQYIGLSKAVIDLTEPEIAQYLLLNNYHFDLKKESKLLIEKFNQFYGENNNVLIENLSSQEKEVLMQHNFELIVKKIFDNQRFKIGYLSNEQEKSWYKFIKPFNRKTI